MTPHLQQEIEKRTDSDLTYGTVPGALFNELQREWQIQKRRADELDAAIQKMERKSYLPQLVAMTEQRDQAYADCKQLGRSRAELLVRLADEKPLRELVEMTEKRNNLARALRETLSAYGKKIETLRRGESPDPLRRREMEAWAAVLKENTI